MTGAPAPRPGGARRSDACQGPRVVGPQDGKAVDLGSVGVPFMARGEESGGGALVEHPIPPRTLAAPLHRHANETAGKAAQALDARYGLEVDYESVARLCAEHGLAFPG